MSPIEHYKPFIRDNHKIIELLICRGSTLIASSFSLEDDDIADPMTRNFIHTDHTVLALGNGQTLTQLIKSRTARLTSANLIVLHDDYTAVHHHEYPGQDLLSLLPFLFSNSRPGSDVICNIRNARSGTSNGGLFKHAIQNNIYTHYWRIKRSGYRIFAKHSVVATNGYPDQVLSFNRVLQKLHYSRTQPYRSDLKQILIQFLILVGVAHVFEPGYFFHLRK